MEESAERGDETVREKAPSTPSRSLLSPLADPHTPIDRAACPTAGITITPPPRPAREAPYSLRPVAYRGTSSIASSPSASNSSLLLTHSPNSSPAHVLLLLPDTDDEDEEAAGGRSTYLRAHSRRRHRRRHGLRDQEADDDFFSSSTSSRTSRAWKDAGRGAHDELGPLAILLGDTKRLSLRDGPCPSPASKSGRSLSSLTRGFDRCRMSTPMTHLSSPSERVKRRKRTPTAPRAMFGARDEGGVMSLSSPGDRDIGEESLRRDADVSRVAQAARSSLKGHKRKLADVDADDESSVPAELSRGVKRGRVLPARPQTPARRPPAALPYDLPSDTLRLAPPSPRQLGPSTSVISSASEHSAASGLPIPSRMRDIVSYSDLPSPKASQSRKRGRDDSPILVWLPRREWCAPNSPMREMVDRCGRPYDHYSPPPSPTRRKARKEGMGEASR